MADGTPTNSFVQENATTPASDAPRWMAWDRETWDSYVESTGETGRPIFHNGGLLGIVNGSTDIDRLAESFNRGTPITSTPNTGTTSGSQIPGQSTDILSTADTGSILSSPIDNVASNPSANLTRPEPTQDPSCEPGIPNIPPGHSETVIAAGRDDNFGWGNDPQGEFGSGTAPNDNFGWGNDPQGEFGSGTRNNNFGFGNDPLGEFGSGVSNRRPQQTRNTGPF